MMMGSLQVAAAAALTSERIGDHLTELQHLARLSLKQAVIMEHPRELPAESRLSYMEKETVLAPLWEHKTRREASDFAPDSGLAGGQSGGGQAGDQWPLLTGEGPPPRQRQEGRQRAERERGPPAGKGGGRPALKLPPKSCRSA